MDRIFEEFEQADSSSTRAHGGAGLGLAISARIVEALGGTIGVSSDLGLGSEFAFEVPAPRKRVGPDARRRARRPPTHVLSKNQVECDAIARMIRAHGGTVDIAAIDEQA